MTLRALLIDDERLARKRLRELLSRHPEIEIVGEAADLDSAVAAVDTLHPDVLFLDVELSPGNGLDLLPRLTRAPAIVFVTAYENFAVQAFAVTAFDYLLKPVHRDRLAQTVRRLVSAAAAPTPAPAPALPAASDSPLHLHDRISLKDGGNIKVVDVNLIAAIKAVGAYSRVMLRDLPPILILRSISDWDRSLPASHFVRLDRSLIIQLPLIRAIESASRDETLLTLDGLPARLSIGRVATQRLKSSAPSIYRPSP